jgi:hypothetical protein
MNINSTTLNIQPYLFLQSLMPKIGAFLTGQFTVKQVYNGNKFVNVLSYQYLTNLFWHEYFDLRVCRAKRLVELLS